MTGRQIRHPGHLRMAVYKAMPAKPAPDYRDVLNLSDEDPSRTPLTKLGWASATPVAAIRAMRDALAMACVPLLRIRTGQRPTPV